MKRDPTMDFKVGDRIKLVFTDGAHVLGTVIERQPHCEPHETSVVYDDRDDHPFNTPTWRLELASEGDEHGAKTD